jgi:hypothetical protein
MVQVVEFIRRTRCTVGFILKSSRAGAAGAHRQAENRHERNALGSEPFQAVKRTS